MPAQPQAFSLSCFRYGAEEEFWITRGRGLAQRSTMM